MIYPLCTLHKTTPGWVMDFGYFAQTRTLCSTNNPQPPNQTQQNPTSLHTLTLSLSTYHFPLTLTSSSLTPTRPIFLSKILQTIYILFIFYSYNHSIIYTEIVLIKKCATPSSLNITLFIVVELAHFYNWAMSRDFSNSVSYLEKA